MIRSTLIAGAALAAFGLAACQKSADTAAGADASATATAPVTPTAPPAADFVNKAAASDMFEIAESKAAQKQSKNAEVKKFAAMMIAGHTKSTAALKAAIAKSGQPLTPPAALPADMQAKVDALGKTAPGDFDKAYLGDQVAAHTEALGVMQAYAAGGDTPALKTFAGAVAPVVQDHLTRATTLQGSMK